MKRKIFSSLLLVAFLCASMGMFVSCKDYEDDINANKDDITALQNQLADLQTTLSNELSSAKSELSTQISDAKAQLQAAIDQKADQATVTALEARVATLEGDLAAKEAALNAKIDAVNEAITGLDGRLESVETALATITAMTGDFTELQQTVNDLKSKVEGLENLDIAAIAREAVEKDLETQKEALEAFKQEIADADYQGQIDKLQEDIAALPTADQLKELADKIDAYDIDNLAQKISAAEDAIAALQSSLSDYATVTSVNELEQALQKQIDDLNELISGKNGLNDNINTLTVFVEKLLNSISLVPDLYVDGIESIEFRTLFYRPVMPGTSGTIADLSKDPVNVDNGYTTATYRLNPSSVSIENIDSANINFVAAVAEVRSVLENSPVKFNGVESFKNGLMTVRLKKTTKDPLSLSLADGKTYIVALKVPRYNDKNKTTTTDIYSENSRLTETFFTPVIAKLEWDPSTVDDKNGHHFADSTTIYTSTIGDDNSISAEVYYDEKKNLAELVTGCYLNGSNKHTQITKDELKKYGIAFRFAIASAKYNDVTNNTDQQQFATVTPEGVVSSKLPDGVTNNMACVGKEPIVRIMLCDTVNNRLLDEKYMKVRWTNKMLDDVVLDERVDADILGCDNMTADLTWDWLITKVYAKVQATGLDQATFQKIYPYESIECKSLDEKDEGKDGVVEFKNSTNANGDAIVGTWTLTPEEVGSIVAKGSRTFTKIVIFKSAIPAEYPDLKMTWTYTISLPELPAISGYFDTYWFNKYETYDVLPVQYNTPGAQKVVMYKNNLTGAFAYTSAWGEDDDAPKFFIKNMTECGTWDIQFSYDGQMEDYTLGINDESVLDDVTNVESFAGYILKETKSGNNAARLQWENRTNAWGTTGDVNATPYLYVPAKENAENWGLINPLAQATNGGIPVRTHDKTISISVWAKINGYNKVLVKKYNVCLIAPIRLDAESEGGFEDGIASGSTVDASDLVSITDFRGYAVADKQLSTTAELKKYSKNLWDYYAVKGFNFDLTNARYTFVAGAGSNISVDNTLSYEKALTAAQLKSVTNGVVDMSLTKASDSNMITFKNNSGSNVEEMFYVYIPVTVKYAFGELKEYVKIPVYPNGQKPSARR